MSFEPKPETDKNQMSPAIATTLTEEYWDKFQVMRKNAGLTTAQLLRQMAVFAIDTATKRSQS